MITVYTYSQIKGDQFKFTWKPSETCNCHFQDIFQINKDMIYLDNLDDFIKNDSTIEFTDFPYFKKIHNEGFTIESFYYFETWDKFFKNLKHKYSCKDTDFYQMYKVNLRKLRLVEKLYEKVEDTTNLHDIRNRIGIHVRRGDHGIQRGGRKTDIYYNNLSDNFFYLIDREIKKNKDIKFLLATDNLKSYEKFTSRYNDRIVTYTTNQSYGLYNEGVSRRCTTLEDAVIELFLLSRCKKIIGSDSSSFGDMASVLGDCPIECARKIW